MDNLRALGLRIVSLLPSATEIVCELGLAEHLVGVSHECDYPSYVHGLPKVTKSLIPANATSDEIDKLVRERLKTERALYRLDRLALERLQPDLIITQTLCEVCAVAESEVAAAIGSLPNRPRVVNLEPTCLEDVFASIEDVGDAAGIPLRARTVIEQLRTRVDAVVERSSSLAYRPRVVLLEWIDPPFCAGHWSPELIEMAGGREMIGNAGERSRTLAWQEIVDADPEFMLIACCGFDVERALADLPTLKSYPGFESLACVRSRSVYVVDGNAYFSRPGPRLVDSLEILANAMHPSVHPLRLGLPGARRLTWEELRGP
jgi:iron complex transport system substrate-binding protein